MADPDLPQSEAAAGWRPPRRRPGAIAQLCRLLLLVIIALTLMIPFTPIAGKIKVGLKDLIRTAQQTRTITREVPVEVPREVEVQREVVREVVREVQVPVNAPQPPLPDKYIPRKDVDVATLFNGITVKTDLQTEQGTYASLERLDPNAYRAEFQLSVRVPKANQTLTELSRINTELPKLLPDLGKMLETGKVSGFYHKLYENKTNSIERDITRLSRILDRHNFFDCETILELTHPASKRRALLIQSEMDVVADGSDGDRMSTLDSSIYLSDYYQPFTSYAWAKTTKNANPLLSRWEGRLKAAEDQYAVKGLSAQRNAELRALIGQLQIEIKEMKNRSSLIADKDPFIVLSLLFRGYGTQNPHTPQMGDYAVVIHEGKMYPAICGDYGPSMKMGEASLFLAKAINPAATPYRRPESDLKVTYLVFPGTAEKPASAPNLDHWYDRCSALLKEIGAPTDSGQLHRWEDPFMKNGLPAAFAAILEFGPPVTAKIPPSLLPSQPPSTLPTGPPLTPAQPGAASSAPASSPASSSTPGSSSPPSGSGSSGQGGGPTSGGSAAPSPPPAQPPGSPPPSAREGTGN